MFKNIKRNASLEASNRKVEEPNTDGFRKALQASTGLVVAAGTSALVVVAGTIALVPPVTNFLNGGSAIQSVQFGLTVLGGAICGFALNTGFRLVNIERELERMRKAAEKQTETSTEHTAALDNLSNQIAAVHAQEISYERFNNSIELWARIVGCRAVNPQVREVHTISKHGGVVHVVDKARIKIWTARAELNYLFLQDHVLHDLSGETYYEAGRHDLRALIRLLVILQEVAQSGRDMSDVYISFSETKSLDLRSLFICDLKGDMGKVRRAVLVYHGGLSVHYRPQQVMAFYNAQEIADAEATWNTGLATASTWSFGALCRRFAEFLPKNEGDIVPSVPRDYVFNPKDSAMWEPDENAFVPNGDHIGPSTNQIGSKTRKVVSEVFKALKRR